MAEMSAAAAVVAVVAAMLAARETPGTAASPAPSGIARRAAPVRMAPAMPDRKAIVRRVEQDWARAGRMAVARAALARCSRLA